MAYVRVANLEGEAYKKGGGVKEGRGRRGSLLVGTVRTRPKTPRRGRGRRLPGKPFDEIAWGGVPWFKDHPTVRNKRP